MIYNTGDIYHGFKLKHQEFINEIKSNALIFEHVKTKARLIKFENDDENKVFSITFRTPPVDNTGLTHILEHSVLCGSRKFRVKEPFVELLKGSLNTFLNAFTFPDKTMYPVASMNTKDFFNLIDVYLDAVFYPDIYNNPLILMQEGSHLELDNMDSPLVYKGIVYNEMKGALSSVNQILMQKIISGLFPDTIYAYESGGEPDNIPELTEEKFLNYHKKYYHPTNSYIYLYGNGDTLEELNFIENKYLKDFEEIKIDSSIKLQNTFDKPVELTDYYPVFKEESKKNTDIFSVNFNLIKSTDIEHVLAFIILEHLLFDTASPLKNALLDADIAEDIFGNYESEVYSTYFSIIAKNCNEKNKSLFNKIVFDTLKEMSDKGIDKKLIEASINQIEFTYREADGDYPPGLSNNILLLTSWLYDEDPLMHLKYENTINTIREKAKANYFEELINKYFLNNNHVVYLNLKGKNDLITEKEKELEIKLKNLKKSFTTEQLNKIIENTKILKEYQANPDSLENINTIPRLDLNDIKKEAETFQTIEKNENEIKILHHPYFTNKIIYLSLLFNTKGVKQDKIKYINLLQELLSELSTKNYDYKDLANEINIHTGGLDFDNHIYKSKDSIDEYFPYFIVSGKALLGKSKKLIELILEIINNTIFNNKKRLKELLLELKSILKEQLENNSINIINKRLFSCFSQSGKYEEEASGLKFTEFINDLSVGLNDKFEDLIQNLTETAKIIFNKSNLIISVTCSLEDYKHFEKELPEIYNSINNSKCNYNNYHFNLKKINEGILTTNQVLTVGMGFNLKKYNDKYLFGHLKVLKTIIGLDYLWNKVRVQGGAYAAGFLVERNGRLLIYSYRDPNLEKTIEVYLNIKEYLKTLNLSKEELTKYIIGTIKNIDKYITQKEKGQIACRNFIIGLTKNDSQKERDEIINFKPENFNEFADMFEKAFKDYSLCVIGNENKIKKANKLFDNIIKVE